ncbi:MAG: GNAT family N-acetyltransferase [Acidobacteria bacterium]|nr:GNAT family N-acetyltransferase [Acidobacteriota bacterium]
MPCTIRHAIPADVATLAKMRHEFRASIAPAAVGDGEFLARCRDWMEQRLRIADGPWRCWVAERDGAIVGHAWLQLVEKIPNPILEAERFGYITNIYVRAEARGAGIGGALVETAVDCCRREGVQAIILWPTPRSRTLYARHGFDVPDDVMEAKTSSLDRGGR